MTRQDEPKAKSGANVALAQRVRELRWYHQIDLGGGIVTPGRSARNSVVAMALELIDFDGKRVLDVGCADGLWTFEAEQRGARLILATDDRRRQTFELAAEARGSHATYTPNLSVYDIASLNESFDVVLFCGVYYHLAHPLLALERLREVTAPGGRLLVEGEVSRLPLNAARFYYRRTLNDNRSNRWVPTVRCLREMVECAGFTIESSVSFVRALRHPGGLRWHHRHAFIARAPEST